MHKKIFFIVSTCIIVCFFSFLLLGQKAKPVMEKSFLWEIKSKKGKSYLIGSVIPFIKEDIFPLQKVIEDAFVESEILVVESKPSFEKAKQYYVLFLQQGMYIGEATLKYNVSDKTYQMVRDRLKELGMDITDFEKYKPWLLSSIIIETEMKNWNIVLEKGIDSYFRKKAMGKKKIKEYGKKEKEQREDNRFTLKLFNDLSKKESEELLIFCIKGGPKIKEQNSRQIDSWLAGDTQRMERLVKQRYYQFPVAESINKKFKEYQQKKMVKRILSYLRTGKTHFIVVDAEYLIGETGILLRLKTRGIEAKQL